MIGRLGQIVQRIELSYDHSATNKPYVNGAQKQEIIVADLDCDISFDKLRQIGALVHP